MPVNKLPVESPGIAGRKAFDELAEVERIDRYRQLSLAVLQRYPLHSPRLEYVGQFDKVIFRVEAGESRRFAFRIHQSSTSAIEPQIAWLTALSREIDLRVPEPIPAEAGFSFDAFTVASAPHYCLRPAQRLSHNLWKFSFGWNPNSDLALVLMCFR